MASRERRKTAHGEIGAVVSSTVSAAPTRGRRRKLPFMTNSERAKYYRQKHAEESRRLDIDTKKLHQHVLHLKLCLDIHRELIRVATPPPALLRILLHVRTFIEEGIYTKSHGLHKQRNELKAVELFGDGTAPIVHVHAAVHGMLTTRVIHAIYPFVLGNSVILDEMMHQEVTYSCLYVFLFSSEGLVERESVELDTTMGLLGPLPDLKTVARVVREVDIHEKKSRFQPER